MKKRIINHVNYSIEVLNTKKEFRLFKYPKIIFLISIKNIYFLEYIIQI